MKTDETLLELVREEAANLLIHATVEERGRLNFDKLYPDNPAACVYGLMTTSCFSERAGELIEQCCSKCYQSTEKKGVNIITTALLNGSPVGKRKGLSMLQIKHYSPIERFLFQNDNENGANNNRILIAYLKGETTELNLV